MFSCFFFFLEIKEHDKIKLSQIGNNYILNKGDFFFLFVGMDNHLDDNRLRRYYIVCMCVYLYLFSYL